MTERRAQGEIFDFFNSPTAPVLLLFFTYGVTRVKPFTFSSLLYLIPVCGLNQYSKFKVHSAKFIVQKKVRGQVLHSYILPLPFLLLPSLPHSQPPKIVPAHPFYLQFNLQHCSFVNNKDSTGAL